MKLAKALEQKKFDLRLRDKLLAEGKLTNEEVDRYLKGLPEDVAKVIPPKKSTEQQKQ